MRGEVRLRPERSSGGTVMSGRGPPERCRTCATLFTAGGSRLRLLQGDRWVQWKSSATCSFGWHATFSPDSACSSWASCSSGSWGGWRDGRRREQTRESPSASGSAVMSGLGPPLRRRARDDMAVVRKSIDGRRRVKSRLKQPGRFVFLREQASRPGCISRATFGNPGCPPCPGAPGVSRVHS
jgi:hypothetical protein